MRFKVIPIMRILALIVICCAGIQACQLAVKNPPEHLTASAGMETDAQSDQAYLPVYPEKALANGVDGQVALSFVIDETGSVGDIQVLDTQPSGVFEQAAKDALSNWHFKGHADNLNACEVAQQAAIVNFAFNHKDRLGRVSIKEIRVLKDSGELSAIDDNHRNMQETETAGDALAVSEATPPSQGVVFVVFIVKPDGTTADINVTRAIPPRVFNRAAIEAISKWRFKPLIRNGKPVSRRTCQTLDFRLSPDQDAAKE